MIKLLVILIASLLSSILYRLGGKGKPFASWMRDWLCPLFALIALCQFGFAWKFWWLYLIFYGLSGASLSTYWDFLFGYDNFWFHGFMCGMSGLPLLFCGIPWWILVIRLVVCTVGIGLWSKLISKDTWEERGRGFFFVW